MALSALLSATALGVFLEGCGGGSSPSSPSNTAGGSPGGSSPDGSPDSSPANSPANSPDDNLVNILDDGHAGGSANIQDDRNVIVGTDGADDLLGSAGDDIIRGGGGNDRLEGGSGKDAFFGGEGIDIVSYRNAPVNSEGGGFTVMINTLFNRGMRGDAQGDTFDSIENLEGSLGHDSLSGDYGPNELYGLAGDDLLLGYNGEDKLYGGKGEDTLRGGEGDDRLEGGDGDDKTLNGEEGDDTILGGEGADTLRGSYGKDILEGGAGADTYIFSIDEGSQEGIIAEDTVREVVEEGVVNILHFVRGGYPIVVVGSEASIDPRSFIFERDGNDLVVVAREREGQYGLPDTSYSTVNRVKLEDYYTTDSGTETTYTVHVQIGGRLTYAIPTDLTESLVAVLST